MSDKDETATYVYCLVQRARAPVLTRAPRGLPGTGRLRALDTGGAVARRGAGAAGALRQCAARGTPA